MHFGKQPNCLNMTKLPAFSKDSTILSNKTNLSPDSFTTAFSNYKASPSHNPPKNSIRHRQTETSLVATAEY